MHKEFVCTVSQLNLLNQANLTVVKRLKPIDDNLCLVKVSNKNDKKVLTS
jgi:hypothetical protein